MGLLDDIVGASEQKQRLLALKDSLPSSEAWKSVANSPMFGSGIRLGFAIVDCRHCGKSDAGLLLDQAIWDMQTHKVSYAGCIDKPELWAAENQGPQAAKTREEWLSGPWAVFNSGTASYSIIRGREMVSQGQVCTLEDWIMKDFLERGLEIKRRLFEVIMQSGNREHIQKLIFHLELEGLRADGRF